MKIEYTPKAGKQFSKLDKLVQSRIKKYMSEITTLDDPRSRGKALTSNLAGLWRYRVGDYRCFVYMTINWLSPSSNLLIAQQSIDETYTL